MAIDNNCSKILWRDPFLLIKKLKFHNALANYSIWASVHKMCRNGHFKLNRDLKNLLSIKKLPCKDRLPELWNCRFRGRNFPKSRRMTLLRHSCAQTENVFQAQKIFQKFFQKSKLRHSNWIELKSRKPEYWRKLYKLV